MAIIKKIAKNGRLLYYNETNGRFSNASAWVKQNFNIIGPGRSKIISKDELTKKEKNVFQGLFNIQNSYRYKGKFLSKDTGRALRSIGIEPGEVSKKVSRGLLATIIDLQTQYKIQSFIRSNNQGKGEYWELKSGTFDRAMDDINSAIRRGYKVTIIDTDGKEYYGRDGVRKVTEFEMEMFLTGEKKTRIEHLVRFLPSKKEYIIDLSESQITILDNTP
jgi:hypothetical protein